MPITTSKIVNGNKMFNNQTYMTTWVDDLECMTSGYEMFADCSNLTTFIGDLSSLTDGHGMFHSCTNLTTFCGDLSSLTDGGSMFSGCKLDAESLECIADTLPIATGETINISYGALATAADAQAAYDVITGKGWGCTMNYNA